MLKLYGRWRKAVSTILSIAAFIAWVWGGIALTLVMIRLLPNHSDIAEILLYIFAILTGVGGLVIFWRILDEIHFWKSGYRVCQLGPKSYFRWTLGPKDCVYEEQPNNGTVQRLPFVRVILGNGYPAPSEILLPDEDVWGVRVPAWASERRAEIVERIIESFGGSVVCVVVENELRHL